jgi:hypothetical protein
MASAKTRRLRRATRSNRTPVAHTASAAAEFTVRRWQQSAGQPEMLSIAFTRTSDEERIAFLEMAAIDDLGKVAQTLRNSGADLPLDRNQRNALLAEVLHTIPTDAGLLAGRSGWHEDGMLVGQRVVGASRNRLMLHPTVAHMATPAIGLRSPSSRWNKEVAGIAAQSTLVSFAILTALAAPLVRFASLDEGAIFNFHGMSSTGKTTAVMAAASTMGPPSSVSDWNATGRGLHELANAFSDLPFVLDDLERFRFEGRSRPDRLSEQLHTLTGGRGTRYAGMVSGQLPQLDFSVWALSTSPRSLAEEFALHGKAPSAGDHGRWIDIPVPDVAAGGIWDRAPEGSSSGALSERLKASSLSCHGWSFKRWAAKLVECHSELARLVASHVNAFVALAAPEANDVQRRRARKFGLAYAAGLLAVDWKLLPWCKAWVREACLAAWTASNQAYLNVTDREAAAWSKLSNLANEASVPTATGSHLPDFAAEAEIGAFRVKSHNRAILYVRRAYLQTLLGAQTEQILARLRGEGALAHGHGGKSGRQLSIRVGKRIIRMRFLMIDQTALDNICLGSGNLQSAR